MKEEHVNETDEEINSIKRQIFLGDDEAMYCNIRICVYVCVRNIRGSFVGEKCARRRSHIISKLPLVVMQPH